MIARAWAVAGAAVLVLSSTAAAPRDAPARDETATAAAHDPGIAGDAEKVAAESQPSDLYDRYLLGHLDHEGRRRGERLMAGESPLPPGVPAPEVPAPDVPLPAIPAPDLPLPRLPQLPTIPPSLPADPTSSAPVGEVTQNGVCNDRKPTRAQGEPAVFWVQDHHVDRPVQRPFVLAAVTEHVYMWADASNYDPSNLSTGAGPVTTRAEAEAGAARFERIYQIDREYFGEPPRCDRMPLRQPPRMQEAWGRPWFDADDDAHINIVNFPIEVSATSFVAGYYSSADEYPTSVNPNSNEGEFFFMNSALLTPGSDHYSEILAHEFYHMIQFSNDANEETWINEGMADIAIELNGFNDSSHLTEYSRHPEDQLTHWDSELRDYGNAYSFLSYLIEHYSPPDDPATPFRENYVLAAPITRTAADGMNGLDEVLAANPFRDRLAPYYRTRTAHDVYLDRGIANILNDRRLADGQYGYGRLSSFKIEPTATHAAYPARAEGDLHPYGEQYLVFESAGDGQLRLQADPRVAIVANVDGMPSPTHELWFDRGDEMETFAVREADLTGARAPRLRFSYWYDIEEDYDYAYLQVSDNGGRTWTNINCACGSRATNPQGANKGNGISGRSGPVPLPDNDVIRPGWQQADQDLSAFAGKRILIRFLYVTDAAATDPGLALDDVSLSDGGRQIWTLESFERGAGSFRLGGTEGKTAQVIDPMIPNRLQLQLIRVGPRVEVTRQTGTPGEGFTSAAGALVGTRTIAIFTSFTPLSSETFHFRWEAQARPLSPSS